MDPELKKLEAALEKTLQEADDLEKALGIAESDEDKAAVQKDLDAKNAEAVAIQGDLEKALAAAEKQQTVRTLLEKSRKMRQTQVPAGADALGGNKATVPAEPEDVVQKQLDHQNIVHKYLAASKDSPVSLSGNEMELVRPRSENFKSGASGLRLPLMTAIKIMGIKWAMDVGYTPAEISVAMKASTMVSSSNALGGFTVPQDFRNTLLNLPVEENHILPRATVFPSPTGTVTIPKAKQTDSDEYGGMAGQWISEGGLKTKSDTQFEQVEISSHEYAMYTQISIRLLQRSAIAMENWIVTRGRQKIMDAMDNAFINGTGSGQPTGILQTAGIRTVARQAANAVGHTDAVRLKRALKPYHRAGGVFVMNDDVGGYLEETKDNEGRPLFSASTANGPYDRLVGFPFLENTRNPSLGTSGDIFFCDLREYYVPMEQEIVAKRSDDYDIVHNLATIVIFVVVGGELVQPRVCAELGDIHGS